MVCLCVCTFLIKSLQWAQSSVLSLLLGSFSFVLVLNIKLDYMAVVVGGVLCYFMLFRCKHCDPVVWNCFLCEIPVILVRGQASGPSGPQRSRTFHQAWPPRGLYAPLSCDCVVWIQTWEQSADGIVCVCVCWSMHLCVVSDGAGFGEVTAPEESLWARSLWMCLWSRPQPVFVFVYFF